MLLRRAFSGRDIMQEYVMCPVCGGRVGFSSRDQVSRCSYCNSPVLGADQDRNCINHPDRLAKGVCHVCGDLVCEDCLQRRVADYGGKLFTIINCFKDECRRQSSWAQPLNPEYQQLTNMDWADSIDNKILRITGLGSVLMMVFELIFILTMLYIQYLTPWGLADPPNIPYWFVRGDQLLVMMILGNFISALLLQTALQVYVHERQLGAGFVLFVLLILEAAFLVYRGLHFNLLNYPVREYPLALLVAFSLGALMILIGSILSIQTGFKKRRQIKHARKELGLTAEGDTW